VEGVVPAARPAPAGRDTRRLRRSAGKVAIALGALLLAATWTAVLAFSEEVQILWRRHGPAEEAEARTLRDERDDVAEIYGVPEGRPVRVVFPETRDRIEPPEAPGTVLLAVDRARGSTPLLARTLAGAGSAGGLLLVVAGFALLAGAGRADPARRE
jgi:hypothetical protein